MTTGAREMSERRGAAVRTAVPGGIAGGPYDVARIRADFPILYRDVYGKPLVYLDNAASAQKPRSVIEAMDHAYRFDYANVHRGMHYLSNTSTQHFEDARETVRRFLNAASADEIIFTKNATAAINLVADSFGANIGEGDEIVLSIMEHHSNIVPWHFLRERKGAVLKWAPIADNGELILEELERLLTPRTKMVAITHMSNVTGTLVPVREVIRLAHAQDIPVLVDGSQAAVHLPIDVQELDADFYVFTGHKTYGPSGIGVLYAKKALLDAMRPYQGGGGMIEHVAVDRITYGVTPHKFEAGTPPIVEAIGLGAALNYMMQVGRENIARHEAELRTLAHAQLAELPWLKTYGHAPGKGAIISFTMDGLHPHDIATIIDRSGVAVRAGHHCAQPLMERLGVTAVCRASFAMYNTKEEVDALADALKRAHELFA
jgi:cysteine desulfurase/selenocysteine lyase